MYNPLLDTFLAVVRCGSFTKAATALYISPTAVMKQINALEAHLGLTLLVRTAAGVRLTPAGEIIRQGAEFVTDYSKKTVAQAKAEEQRADTTFCVGTSLLNPAKPFMNLWYRLSAGFPDYKLHLVPFADNHEGILSEIGKLGEKFDFLVGVCDSRMWLSMCAFLPLGRYRKMVAVSRKHRLAERQELSVEDLYGETLMMVRRGDSEVNDRIREDLVTHHPQITIEDTDPFYDLSVFNRCAESNRVLLSIECWKDVHPGLVTIPVRWDYSIPYGLLYAFGAPPDVLAFADAVRRITPPVS